MAHGTLFPEIRMDGVVNMLRRGLEKVKDMFIDFTQRLDETVDVTRLEEARATFSIDWDDTVSLLNGAVHSTSHARYVSWHDNIKAETEPQQIRAGKHKPYDGAKCATTDSEGSQGGCYQVESALLLRRQLIFRWRIVTSQFSGNIVVACISTNLVIRTTLVHDDSRYASHIRIHASDLTSLIPPQKQTQNKHKSPHHLLTSEFCGFMIVNPTYSAAASLYDIFLAEPQLFHEFVFCLACIKLRNDSNIHHASEYKPQFGCEESVDSIGWELVKESTLVLCSTPSIGNWMLAAEFDTQFRLCFLSIQSYLISFEAAHECTPVDLCQKIHSHPLLLAVVMSHEFVTN
ncbi:hypothetical protein C8R48DRAFT_680245 [Suillus tomentosus]|nr:hypothetical protein C8R48DRAFT_680245 [Suillus tomentosus]